MAGLGLFCSVSMAENSQTRIHIIFVVEKRPIKACEQLFLPCPDGRDVSQDLLKMLEPDRMRQRET